MARPKRKLTATADAPASASASSKRQKKEVDATASASRPSRTSLAAAAAPRPIRSNTDVTSKDAKKGVGRPRKATSTSNNTPASRSSRSSVNKASSTAKDTVEKPRRSTKKASTSTNCTPIKKSVSTTKTTRGRKKSVKTESAEDETAAKTKITVDVSKSKAPVHDTKAEHDRGLEENIDGDGPSFWLMKAEPESRVTEVRCHAPWKSPSEMAMLTKNFTQKGKDVKFSIDDLKAATAPEAWDGMMAQPLRLWTEC